MARVLSGGNLTAGGVIVSDPGVPVTSFGPTSAVDAVTVWESQPHVRTVVDFIARNVAAIPMHVHRRISGTDRERVTDHEVVTLLQRPAPLMTPFRWWHQLIVDFLLWDRWCVHKMEGRLQRIPPERFELVADVLGNLQQVHIIDGRGQKQAFDPKTLIVDHGYGRWGTGTSPMVTLSELLEESQQAVQWRRQVWRNGARMSAVIERPQDAPAWSQDAKQRFRESMRDYLNDGSKAGGVPLLEDGMELKPVSAFSPSETRDIESRQLSAVEVANAYHVPPEILGFRPGNYSNVREYRQQLYRDVLGPLIVALEQAINTMLVGDFGDPQLYAEFEVDAKLRASFEEQAAVLQTAVGAPYMTRNEARGMRNLPSVDDGDELVTPLNVTTGGLASPRDTAPKSGTKARDPEPERASLGKALAGFHARQRDEVLQRLVNSQKAMPSLADSWDTEGYDTELSRILSGWMIQLAQLAAVGVLEQFNPEGDGFDEDNLAPYLLVAARSNAEEINQGIYDRLAKVVSEPDWRDKARSVLEDHVDNAGNTAESVSTEAESFGSHDAARASGLTVKVWRTRSGAREEHKRVNGERVGIDEVFSNGGRWPGDKQLPPWERVNCRCRLAYEKE